MKHFFYCLLFGIFLLSSCSKFADTSKDEAAANYLTKAISGGEDFSVSVSDVRELLRGESKIVDIKSYPTNEEPLLYVVRCSPGFYLISGDKRADPIVAYSYINDIAENTQLEEFILKEYSKPIRVIKTKTVISEQMATNLAIWDAVCQDSLEVDTKDGTKCYYKVDSKIESTRRVFIDALLDTEWGQGNHYTNDHYWNEYCPWADSTCTGAKSLVGCVAVAGGQIAYYMRNRTGVTVRFPREALCTGYVGNYTQSFSTITTVSWIDEMPLNYNDYTTQQEHARVFLAYIGYRVGMSYSPTYSWAQTQSLVPLFDEWGMDAYFYNTFDNSTVITQLLNDLPVIARGADTTGVGHVWIIDGYSERLPIIRNYYYDSDVISNDLIADSEVSRNGRVEEGIQSSFPWLLRDEFHMNWGWDGQYDGWYSISNWSVAGESFNTGKCMLLIN